MGDVAGEQHDFAEGDLVGEVFGERAEYTGSVVEKAR